MTKTSQTRAVRTAAQTAAQTAPPTPQSIWSTLLPLFVAKRDSFFRVMADHELTPPHGMALMLLIDAPMRMRDIADRMVCDASYVTAVVDRLEQLALASRRASDTDRRVKEIALTARGRAVATQIQTEMSAAPAAFHKLSAKDLATMRAILDKLDLAPADSFFPKGVFRHEP